MGHNLILVKDYSIFLVERFILLKVEIIQDRQRWVMRRGDLCCRGAPAGPSTRLLESVLEATVGTGKSLNKVQEDHKKDFCLLEIWDKDQMIEGKLICSLDLPL